ncbi:MAG: nucleotidyltransferase family protein [Anaerolineae bacterium]|nr:nucleotidyltransferase family protein [Anaerolineae bacterium]
MDDRAAPAAVDNDLFLRLCLRSRWRPDGLREAEKLAANGHVSWPDLCETARAGGLAPLLHDVLRSSRFVPETARRCLQDAYQETAIYAGLMSVELGRVLRRLEDAGLPAIVLKGAALGDTLYGNSALRPMTDLDLLLRERDIPVAIDLMTRSGYHTAGVEVRPGHMLAYENEVALRSPGTPALAVELHWHLLDSPFYQDQVDEGWFWDTAQPARVAETGALVLGLEGTFLHLSAHYVLHHKAHGMRWIYDLAGLAALHGEALDWQLLLDRAAAFKLVTSIQVVLQQLADDWNVALPPDVLRAAHALPVSDEERRVIQWLHADQRPVVQRFWADLASMSGWRQRLPFLLASLFPSPDYMEDRYELRGRVLLPLAYPYRWVSGLREFLASSGKDNG